MVKRPAEIQASEDNSKKAKMATPMNVDSEAGVKIDEDLHSRQLAVYGKESMKRMANASVLIVGVKGLGVEVGAKPGHRCCDRLWHCMVAAVEVGRSSCTNQPSLRMCETVMVMRVDSCQTCFTKVP